ncbi:MAG: hypothetical protein JW939_01455 [Candidatus Thermoplasmatota archaeon]|nr:hypothetical protein [Candidatus Thermoplasmatota archaeon]
MDFRRYRSFQPTLALMLLISLLSTTIPVGEGAVETSPDVDDMMEFVPMKETLVLSNGFPQVLSGIYGPEVTMDGLDMDPRASYLRLPIIQKEIELPLGSVDVEVDLRDTVFTYIPVPAGIGRNPHSIPKAKDGSPLVPDGGFEAPVQHLDHRIMTGINIETLGTMALLSVSISPVVPEGGMLRCMVSGVVDISYHAPTRLIWYDPEIYDVLVICPEEFLGTAARYADFRNATGRYTKVVTLPEILNDRYWEVKENDTQEEIKRFIYNARLEWGIDFVMLAGDVEHIPTRHILVLDGYDDSGTMRTDGAFVPTDLYYSDLFEEGTLTFTNWNADRAGDSKYLWGEYDGMIRDDPDLYPDIFVGRLPASTAQEFSDMFEKIRRYELEAKGSDWFYNATLCGTNTFTEHPTPEGEYTCNYIASTFLDGFNVTKLYETTGTLFNISTVIDQGTGLLVFSDHGDYDGWGYTQAFPWGAYRSINASRQENGHELPIAVLDACLTHGFDNENASDPVSGKDPVYGQWYYPPGSSLDERDCLGEYLGKNPDGGAIATFGCTRVGYGSLGPSYPSVNSGYFNVRLNKAFAEGVQTPGQVLARAQKDFIINIGVSGVTSYKTVTEYILLGDPSLNIGGIAGTNVEIDAERDNITVTPGTEAQLNMTVRNIGIIPVNVLMNITVEGNGMSVWTANTSEVNGSIPVGGSIDCSIFVYAPPNALFGQERNVVLRVDSLLLPRPRTFIIEAIAARTEGVDIFMDPPLLSAPQGSDAIGFVNIENLGNGREDFTVSFPDLPVGWEVEMDPFTVEVDPFTQTRFPFKLTVPGRSLAGTTPYLVAVESSITGAHAAALFNMTVEPDLSFDLSLPALTVKVLPEENTTIPFHLIGWGNVNVQIDIGWTCSRTEGWDIEVINGSQVLPPFTNGTGGISVRPPAGTDPGVYTMRITADSGIEEKEAFVDIIVLKEYGFSVVVGETLIEAGMEERVSFHLNVSNLGNIYDQYNLTLSGSPPGNWSISLNPPSFSVPKGSWKMVYLDITPGFMENGTYDFSVSVKPWSGIAHQTVDMRVVIGKSFGFDLVGELSQPVVKPGGRFEDVLELRNLGNTNDFFLINASMEGDWPVHLSTTNISLNYSGSADIGIGFDIPVNALAGKYTLSLFVLSRGAGTFTHFERTIFVSEVYSLRVETDLNGDVLKVRPGRLVQLDVKVLNEGNTPDSVTIGVSSSSYVEGWISLSSSNFNRIDPGDNRTFQVILDVPGNASEGDYRISIWVDSFGDAPANRLNLTLKIEEKGAGALFSSVDPLPVIVAAAAGLGIILIAVFLAVRAYRKASGMDLEDAGMEWEEDEEEADWE